MLVLKGITDGKAEVLAVRKEQVVLLNYWRDKCYKNKITVEIVLASGKEVGIVIHESNINVLEEFIEGKTTQEPKDVKELLNEVSKNCANTKCSECEIESWCKPEN